VVPVRNFLLLKHPRLIGILFSLPPIPFPPPPDSIYKIPDGKPENQFAFSGEAKNKKYATAIIHECNEAWRRLIYGDSPAKTPNYELSMYALPRFLRGGVI
jgi:hypothetical protein